MIGHPDRLLADADPVRELDPAPSEELLAQPRSSHPARRTRRARRLVLTPRIALLAAAVVGVVRAPSPSGPVLALAAQASARLSAAPGEILHTVGAIESSETTATGRTFETGSIEGGTAVAKRTGSSATTVPMAISPPRSITVISADGVMRQVDQHGGDRIVCRTDNEDAANVIAQEQSGFVKEFRRLYERGGLDPGGTARFAGRPAQRYVVSAQQNTPKIVVDGRTVPAPARRSTRSRTGPAGRLLVPNIGGR